MSDSNWICVVETSNLGFTNPAVFPCLTYTFQILILSDTVFRFWNQNRKKEVRGCSSLKPSHSRRRQRSGWPPNDSVHSIIFYNAFEGFQSSALVEMWISFVLDFKNNRVSKTRSTRSITAERMRTFGISKQWEIPVTEISQSKLFSSTNIWLRFVIERFTLRSGSLPAQVILYKRYSAKYDPVCRSGAFLRGWIDRVLAPEPDGYTTGCRTICRS